MTPFSCCLRTCSLAVAILPLLVPTDSLAAPGPQRNFIILHRLGGTDGDEPVGPLVRDGSGNLYGETTTGGSNGGGVAYEISPRGARWKETVLHNFSMADGVNPLGGLTLDDAGNLYGTEFSGPAYGGGVFELSPAVAGTWNFTQLYTFIGLSPEGSNPYGGVLRDESGDLYGTTYYGGADCCGTVFRLSPSQNGWTASVLHSFRDKHDGAYPAAAIIRNTSGTFYGTTSEGGDGHCGDGEGDKAGCGTIFALTSTRHRITETQLYDFQNNEENAPYAPLTFGQAGVLYGTAGYDVFELVPLDGGGWQKQVIYEFKEGIAGTITSSGVAMDAAGNLYGTTSSSGLDGFSTVYELSPPPQGSKKWTHHTLARLGNGLGGPQPRGGVLIGPDGTLYGVATAQPGFVFAIR